MDGLTFLIIVLSVLLIILASGTIQKIVVTRKYKGNQALIKEKFHRIRIMNFYILIIANFIFILIYLIFIR